MIRAFTILCALKSLNQKRGGRPMDLRMAVLVALGGAAGALLRYGASTWLEDGSMPWATLSVNLIGALLLGALMGAVAGGAEVSEGVVLLVGTGVLGAFTTMSAFALEVVDLADSGSGRMTAYLLATVVGSVVLAWVGYRSGFAIVA